jgi:hypothetical protein
MILAAIRDGKLKVMWSTVAEQLGPNKVVKVEAVRTQNEKATMGNHYMVFACNAESLCRTLQAYQKQLDLAAFVATLLYFPDDIEEMVDTSSHFDEEDGQTKQVSQKLPLRLLKDVLCGGVRTTWPENSDCGKALKASTFPSPEDTPAELEQTFDLSGWGTGRPIEDVQRDLRNLGTIPGQGNLTDEAGNVMSEAARYVDTWIRLAGKPPNSNVVSDYTKNVTGPYIVAELMVAPLVDEPAKIVARLKEIANIEETVESECGVGFLD